MYEENAMFRFSRIFPNMVAPIGDAVMRLIRHSRRQVLQHTAGCRVTPSSAPSPAEVLPTQLLALLGFVWRKSIMHKNDLACVGYQRALKNPAVQGHPFDRV